MNPLCPHFFFPLGVLFGAGLALTAPLQADVSSDLAFSAFAGTPVNIDALAGGQILQPRSGLPNFQRGITAQSLYIIDAAPAEVAHKLLTWNPASHPELKVWMHQSLPAKLTPTDFGSLSSLPDNNSVGYLISATASLDPNSPSLQISREEAQGIAALKAQNPGGKTLFANFWSQVLAGRVNNFLGGRFASDTYSMSDGDIHPFNEIVQLIRSDSKMYADFHPLFSQTPLYGSLKLAPANLYYECFDVENDGALGTGAIYQITNGTAIQSADIEFYINSGIYADVELEKLWPVNVNGKTETLVWREDLVSTANIAYLHGMERMASVSLMMQDVRQGINAFRSEFK
ncbi:MAG TPA: hypothetical protein VL981_06285 [Candidatus Methylacidiphilales bacterium]|nr:hypothetical protein [Candidatus Methylacidiphilales bacterium]